MIVKLILTLDVNLNETDFDDVAQVEAYVKMLLEGGSAKLSVDEIDGREE